MPSRGKKKTTMAKFSREARLRERRSEKAARKEARREAALNPPQDPEPQYDEFGVEIERVEDHDLVEDHEAPAS